MNVEIGTEAAQFPEKEYINGIFVAVWCSSNTHPNDASMKSLLFLHYHTYLLYNGPIIYRICNKQNYFFIIVVTSFFGCKLYYRRYNRTIYKKTGHVCLCLVFFYVPRYTSSNMYKAIAWLVYMDDSRGMSIRVQWLWQFLRIKYVSCDFVLVLKSKD